MKHLASHPQIKSDALRSMAYLGDLEGLVREALSNRRSPLWGALQETLFHMNLKLMSEGFALGTQRSELEWKFRALVESVEKEMLPEAHIPPHIVDPEEFLDWLKARIYEHRVTDHELFVYFDKNDLSDEEIRYFLSNYRVNMQRFHLHVAAYSLFVPFKMREELYENLHDEFGEGDFEQAHPNLFEPLMDHFGGAREDDWNPETFHLLNTKINLCWFADGLPYGLGGMGALELTIPAQQRRILANLRRRGLNEKLVRFFVVHCELDESHGDGWFAAGLPYIRSRSDFEKVYVAAMRMLDARAGVYDGILAGILRRRLEAQSRKIAADQLEAQAQVA
ncbi:iron-containing redox enzyme family protein [Dyella sp. M7H15-1]|uniref:iron-containing redox enzyme family protein n=1 Tax=Dyella sp. M7H15-1 TaxID=2501295 RepID=UPI0010051A7E|nr:iron-containing redox enzyme family protein [Dyella sp. M7H15-1]QAU23003.1 iron-containing redox enzyme family protein [Dyella sp. M7H15-1]